MKKSKTKNDNMLLPELVDTIFSVCEEKIEDCGEDCYVYSVNECAALLAVCDGCGGLGATSYPEWGNRTGAYLASRMVIFSLQKWFNEICDSGHLFDEKDSIHLKELIQKGLCLFKNNDKPVSKIQGSLVRQFPTTLAAAITKYDGQKIIGNVLWAGDSRVYCLTSQGLFQLSVDDIYGEDALSNLTKDGALKNVISSDGNYKIHSEMYDIPSPGIVISSTDGCFGYIPTPMHFEFMLLTCLNNAKNVVEWKENILKVLQKVAGDDATMCLATFGYGSFSELKSSLQGRLDEVKRKYIIPLEDANDEMVRNYWNEYKQGYYGMLKQEYKEMYL